MLVNLPTERNPALVLVGDCKQELKKLPAQSVHTFISSPPYFSQRDYGVEGQLGLEDTPEEYVENLVAVYTEAYRVLRDDGTCWVNLGDSYANDSKWGGATSGKHVNELHGNTAVGRKKRRTGLKPKELVGVPWMFAFAMREAGWLLRSEITLCKLSPMPESAKDRPTSATEKLFLFTKQPTYFYDKYEEMRIVASSTYQRLNQNLAKQKGSNRANGGARADRPMHTVGGLDGANLWNYWPFRSSGSKESHFAAFHLDLPRRCLDLATSAKGVCPACGAPWKRLVEKERKATRPGHETKVTGDSLTDGNRDPQRHVTETKTIGWQASCECNAGEPIGAIVLDCFAGTGTTMVAAIEAGRRAIGIELNPDYAQIIHKRLLAPLGVGGLFGPEESA